MDYKDYLEEAKKYLSDTDTLKKYREYYENAVDSVKGRRDAEIAEINRAFRNDLNEASAANRILEKNAEQFMAARGLSRSGEAEQEYIERSLGLAKKVSSLAEERRKSESAARSGADAALAELDKQYAEKANDESKRLENEAAAMAKAGFDAENAKAEKQAERDYNETLLRIKAELAEAAAQKEREHASAEAAKKREYEAVENAKKREHELEMQREKSVSAGKGAQSGETPGSAETASRPKQTATQFAKEIAAERASSGGKIKTVSDVLNVDSYLKELERRGELSAEYLKDVRAALSGLGYYVPDGNDEAAYRIAGDSEEAYKKTYSNTLKACGTLRIEEKDAKQYAAEMAQNARLDYCIKRCDNAEQFKKCCVEIGVSESEAAKYLKENADKLKSISGGAANDAQSSKSERTGGGGGRSANTKTNLAEPLIRN